MNFAESPQDITSHLGVNIQIHLIDISVWYFIQMIPGFNCRIKIVLIVKFAPIWV